MMGLKRKAKTYSCGQILGNFLCIHKIVATVCSKTPHPLTKNLSASNNVIHVTNETLTLKLNCAALHIHIDLLSAEEVIACSLSDDNSGILVIFSVGLSVPTYCVILLERTFALLQFCSSLRVVLGVPFVRRVKYFLSVAIYAWALVRLLTLSSAYHQVI